MFKLAPAFAALAAILWSFHANAAVALLKDINHSATPGSAGASNFLTANGLTLFVGYDATYGQELWCTDGTSAGTHIVRDIARLPALIKFIANLMTGEDRSWPGREGNAPRGERAQETAAVSGVGMRGRGCCFDDPQ